MSRFKRILSAVLTAVLVVSTFPAVALANGGESGEVGISNGYMRFTFNKSTGGFAIETKEGNPKKVLDNDIPLLYAEDKERSNGTSFITVRIDGRDYVFGQDYGLFSGTSSRYGDIVYTGGTEEGSGGSIAIPWTVNDVTVTLTAALSGNEESDTTGNVGLSFKVENGGTSAHSVGIRLLLDTALGDKIDAPYFVVDGKETPTLNETEYKEASVPEQIRSVDSLTSPSRMAYLLTKANGWSGGEKPKKVILGHWANLANTRYDYSVDSSCDFSNYSNDYRIPDSAAALYWETGALVGGTPFVGELLYGVGNFSKLPSDTPLGIDISIGRVELQENAGDGKASYKDGGVITAKVTIDNTVDNATALSGVEVNFKYDTDKFTLTGGNPQVKYDSLSTADQPKVLTYELTAKEQEDLCAGTVFVSVKGYRVTSSGLESFETAAERSVILPSVGTVSEVQMNKVSPETVYTDGVKAVTITGKMKPLEAFLADNSNAELWLYHKTVETEKVEIEKKDIGFLDNSCETLTFTTDKTLVVGEYEIVFEIGADSTLSESLNCTSLKCNTTLEVSADSKYRLRSYGMMALLRINEANGSNVKYDFYKFNSENDFRAFWKGEAAANGEYTGKTVKHNFSGGDTVNGFEKYEILLTIRANLREMDDETTGKAFWQAEHEDGDIVINNMLSYEGDTPFKVYKKGDELRVEGDGLLKVVNSATVWRSDWSISVKDDGTELYTLNTDALSDAFGSNAANLTLSELSLSLEGAGVMVQTLGGFAVDLKYGVLNSDWVDDEILYGISFGGKISIPIKAKKDKTDDTQSDPNQFNQTTGEAYALEDIAEGAEDPDDFSESLHNLFDETLTDDVEDYSDEFTNLFDESVATTTPDPAKKSSFDKKAVVSSLKDKVMKDDDNLPEGQLSATVNNVLFGEKTKSEADGSVKKDTGFIGIDAEFEIALPEDVLGSFVSNAPGLSAQVKIDTIDHEYELYAGLDIKIISCEGRLAFKQVSVKNKDTIVPDKIEFYLRGLKIPIAPPVLYMTGLGGGINDLADTIGGEFDELPPITILLYTQLEAIGVLVGDFNASISLEGLSLEGDMTLKTNGLAKVMQLDAGISARWIEPWELSLYGNVSIIDGIIRGGITVTIADDYFYGYVYASIYVPDSIPLVGGKELAGVEAAVSHEFIGANIKIIGIKFGVIYYWGDNVSFGKNIDLSPPEKPNPAIDTTSSASAIGYYGTNVFSIPVQLVESGASVMDVTTPASTWKQTTVKVTTAVNETTNVKQDALLLEIPYRGKATPSPQNIKLKSPAGDVALTPDNGNGGGNMLVQSREDGDYIYITVTEANMIENGDWTVSYDADADLEILSFSMNGVSDIPELSKAEGDTRITLTSASTAKPQTATVSWKLNGAQAGDKGTIDVYLTTDEEIRDKIKTSKNTGDILGTNILHEEDVDLKGFTNAESITKYTDPTTKEELIKAENIKLPEALPDGKYYALVVLSTTEGISLASSKSCIDFENPYLPQAELGDDGVKISYGGNGEIFVSVNDVQNPDYTHYLAEIVANDGTVLENSIGQFEAGKSFTFGKEAVLTPGKEYYVLVQLLREEYKKSGTDENSPKKKHYYYGSTKWKSNVYRMPESFDPPKLTSVSVNFDTTGDEINTNVKDVVLNYTFDKPVFVELDLNGSKVYAFGENPNPKDPNFSYFKREWQFVLDDLDDGDYIIDFAAYCENKDHIIGSQTGVENAQLAFAVDTSAPVLTLSRQAASVYDENGNVLRSSGFGANTVITDGNGKYKIVGVTEPSARLLLDGEELTAQSEGVTLLSGGGFEITRTLANGETYREHTLSAIDKAGNKASVTAYAVRRDAFSFDDIKLYLNGNEIKAVNGVKSVNLKNGQQASLSVYGSNKNGDRIAIDNDLIDWSVLYSKNTIEFDDGEVAALTAGETAVKAKLVTGSATTASGASRSEGLVDYVVFNIAKNTREELADKVETAKTLLRNNSGASDAKKDALQAAIDEAESVLENQASTDNDYTAAVTKLQSAINAFKSTGSGGTGSSGGSGVKRYSVRLEKTEHGTVKASQTSVEAGNSITITAVPDDGYVVADMLINGVSVGRTETYTVRSVDESITVKVIFAEKSELPFNDVLADDWFYRYVKEAYENGYMRGTTETRFEPETHLTRAMFTTILYRLEGEPEVSGETPLEDIDPEMYYLNAVVWAYQNKIINGVSDKEFAPDAEVTREQMAAIIYRYMSGKGADTSIADESDASGYSDFDKVSPYAVEAFKYATAAGIITGTSSSTLSPLENATRAEAATIFVRLADILKK